MIPLDLNLKRIYDGASRGDQAATIDSNLESIGYMADFPESLMISDYVEQLEQATTINDENTRKQFLVAVRALRHFRALARAASAGVTVVRAQISRALAGDDN